MSGNPAREVLFVDDEEMLRKYFARAFADTFLIRTAADIVEGRRLLEIDQGRIVAVVCDHRMPGGSGVDLLRWAAAHRPAVMRVLATAYFPDEPLIGELPPGLLHHFVQKPWSRQGMLGILTSAPAHPTPP